MSKQIKETPVLTGEDARLFEHRIKVHSFLNKWGMVTSKETGGHVKHDSKNELLADTLSTLKSFDYVYHKNKIKAIKYQTISSILTCISFLCYIINSINGVSRFSIIFHCIAVLVILYFFIRIYLIQKKDL